MPESRSDDPGVSTDVSRRSFLKGVGTGVVSSAVIPGIAAAKDHIEKAAAPLEGVKQATISLKVNGRNYRVNAESRATLASVLRDKLGLIGTKIGCNNGECGCCTVLIDGEPVYSCLTLALDVDGRDITTIEGIGDNGELSPVQEAFIEDDAYQCGFCTPGQVLTATALLKKNPNPTVDEIKQGMSGNLCRCGAYQHIVEAVANAAQKMRR